jgi:thymidylate synthase
MDRSNIPKRFLDCQLYQRSADVFLGVPFNIASYAFLTHMIAHTCGLAAGEFIWTGGDCHLYTNHAEQVEELLSRKSAEALPVLRWKSHVPKAIDEYTWDDFKIDGYSPQPTIKAPVAV